MVYKLCQAGRGISQQWRMLFAFMLVHMDLIAKLLRSMEKITDEISYICA